MNAHERYQSYLIGPIAQFDQRREMFKRARYEPKWRKRAEPFYTDRLRDKPGYTQEYHDYWEGKSMSTVAIPQITERLQKLPSDKLVVVYDFVSYLLERERPTATDDDEEAWDNLLARPQARQVLRRMAQEAVEDLHAGRVTDIIITDDGLLAPG